MRTWGPTALLASGLTSWMVAAWMVAAFSSHSAKAAPAAVGSDAPAAGNDHAGGGAVPTPVAPVAATNAASDGAVVPPAPPAPSPPPITLPANAAGDGAAPPPPRPALKRFPRLKQPSLLHLDQFGLAVLPGSGYRIIAPYQDMVPCGQQNKRVCTGWLPFFIDVQPSFGLTRHWDALVDLRFGVVADFSQSHQFAVAPGFRYWVDPDLDMKFFATFQGVYDLNPQHDPGVKDYDFGARNANGFMFEVMRNLGFYLQFGETLAFVRWLRFEVDGGIGIQARFP